MKISQLIKSAVRRSMLQTLPAGSRVSVIFKTLQQFDARDTAVGTHLVQPSEFEFFAAYEAEAESVTVYL